MKRILFILLSVFMLASSFLYAAGSKVKETEEKVKVGLVTDVGKVDDKTFNQLDRKSVV